MDENICSDIPCSMRPWGEGGGAPPYSRPRGASAHPSCSVPPPDLGVCASRGEGNRPGAPSQVLPASARCRLPGALSRGPRCSTPLAGRRGRVARRPLQVLLGARPSLLGAPGYSSGWSGSALCRSGEEGGGCLAPLRALATVGVGVRVRRGGEGEGEGSNLRED